MMVRKKWDAAIKGFFTALKPYVEARATKDLDFLGRLDNSLEIRPSRHL